MCNMEIILSKCLCIGEYLNTPADKRIGLVMSVDTEDCRHDVLETAKENE